MPTLPSPSDQIAAHPLELVCGVLRQPGARQFVRGRGRRAAGPRRRPSRCRRRPRRGGAACDDLLLGRRAARRRAGPASSRPAAVPDCRAATTGMLRLPARRSDDADFPVTCGSPTMPSTSSTSWKARPTSRPYSASGPATSSPAPAARAPIAVAHEISAAVLPPSMRSTSSSVASRLVLEREVLRLPADQVLHGGHQVRQHGAASAGRRAAAPRWPRSASRCRPGSSGPSPKTTHPVGRCRRSVSRSMMSSCSSEKLCTSSTATPAGTPASASPHGLGRQHAQRGTDRLAAAALDRPALGVPPAELVAGDQPHPRVVDVLDGVAQRRLDEVAGAGDRVRRGQCVHAANLTVSGPATPSAASAAATPLRTALSIVSGQPGVRPRPGQPHAVEPGRRCPGRSARRAGRLPERGVPLAGDERVDARSARRASGSRSARASTNCVTSVLLGVSTIASAADTVTARYWPPGCVSCSPEVSVRSKNHCTGEPTAAANGSSVTGRS